MPVLNEQHVDQVDGYVGRDNQYPLLGFNKVLDDIRKQHERGTEENLQRLLTDGILYA